MKKIAVFLALGLTGACMATEETGPSISLTTTDSNFNEGNLVGQTFGGTGVTMRFGAAAQSEGTITLSSPLTATLDIDGETAVLNNFGGTSFDNVLGEEAIVATRLNGGPVTRDVLYILTQDLPPPSLGGARVGFFVDGNETALTGLPTGSVNYTGAALGVNAAGNTRTGSVTLSVDFMDNAFDATLSGVNAAAPSASYFVVGGAETNGQLDGDIIGGGVLNGAIYGSAADQAAGTFLVDSDDTTLIGAFGARN